MCQPPSPYKICPRAKEMPASRNSTYNDVAVLLGLVKAPDEELVGPLNEAIGQPYPVLGTLLQNSDEVAIACEPQGYPLGHIGSYLGPVRETRATMRNAEEETSSNLLQNVLVVGRVIPCINQGLLIQSSTSCRM